MEKKFIYDWPLRVFHFFFALFFASTFFIAKTVEDESALFPYHMLGGMMLAMLICIRVFWGIIGPRSARFSSFDLKPSHLWNYFKAIARGQNQTHSFHNPATSWAAVIMFSSTLGLALTGYNLSTLGENHFLKEVHEIFAHVFFATAMAHIGGVVFHTLKNKDPIYMAMISGKKNVPQPTQATQSSYSFYGLLFLGIILLFANYLSNQYNSETRQLTVFGQVLTLGEIENNNEQELEHDDED